MAEMKGSKCEACGFAGRFGFTLSVFTEHRENGSGKGDLQTKARSSLIPYLLLFRIFSQKDG